MSRIDKAIQGIHEMDTRAEEKSFQGIHPLVRLFVTFFYLLIVVSFSKYDILGLLSMVLYLMIQQSWYEISIQEEFRRIWPVFLLVCVLGVVNPLLDREICFQWNGITVTCGMISMVTLLLKGIFCVMASYLLIVTTGIGGICYSLRCLHVPREIVTVVLLVYRYLIVLLKEAERMMQAYHLRAPGQRGIPIKAWGTFIGQLLLRSIDRAELVYESMQLRGFQGEFPGRVFHGKIRNSLFYLAGWTVMLLFLRLFPLFELVGGILFHGR